MSWDVNKAITYARGHALSHSSGNCAHFTREAIEAGGVNLVHHVSAKDYGSSLILAGFRPIPSNGYLHLPGDVAIVHPIPGHPHGHMAMFDGIHWISDFTQFHGVYPGPAYREANLGYTLYRCSIAWTGPDKAPSGNLASQGRPGMPGVPGMPSAPGVPGMPGMPGFGGV